MQQVTNFISALNQGKDYHELYSSGTNTHRSLHFYHELLGFEITTHYDSSAVFLSTGGYHHHIGLPGIVKMPLDNPDGNGVELYWDRPKEEWPKDERGNLQMFTEGLDLQDLLKLAG